MQPRRFNGRKRKNGRVLRHPHTQQEKRLWHSHIDQLQEFPNEAKMPRWSRSPKKLSDVWDDIWRECFWHCKDWKLHRKTQWR